jgi:hypothetical protein
MIAGELAAAFPAVSRPSVSKHLRLLSDALDSSLPPNRDPSGPIRWSPPPCQLSIQVDGHVGPPLRREPATAKDSCRVSPPNVTMDFIGPL